MYGLADGTGPCLQQRMRSDELLRMQAAWRSEVLTGTRHRIDDFASVMTMMDLLGTRIDSADMSSLVRTMGAVKGKRIKWAAREETGIAERGRCSPFHSSLFVPKGHRSHELMMLDTSHASQPCEGGRGTLLCGLPLRRSTEHCGSAVRAGASFVRRSRAQRHRSRRRRRAFMWGARCSNGPLGLSLDGTDAGTFDSVDIGLGLLAQKKSFSGAGTLDVTGNSLRHSPYSEKSFIKEAKFDSETGTFELTGSGPGQSTFSKNLSVKHLT